LAYTLLARRADELDRVFLLAQLLGGKAEELDPQPHRDDLDSALAEPFGSEAEAMDRLVAYLKGVNR
jgi:hypothetical protein